MSTTSLALRSLLAQAAARTKLDANVQLLAGLSPAARALAVAVAARRSRHLTLVVVPTDKDVDVLVSDLRFFLAALEGASDLDVRQSVLGFPSWQVDPYRGMTPHFRVASARARALYGAACNTAKVVVASAAALLPRVSGAERLLRAAADLAPGTEIDPQVLADRLTDGGFTREDPVEEHGTFTIRGGIVDVFPAGDAEPVRVEFVGDQVESMRRFDPATQRSTGSVDRLVVVPVRERFEDDTDLLSAVDAFGTASGLDLLIVEADLVDQQLNGTRDQLDAAYADAAARGPVTVGAPLELFADAAAISQRLASGRRRGHVELGAVAGRDQGRLGQGALQLGPQVVQGRAHALGRERQPTAQIQRQIGRAHV